jgi:hypothetical protein
VYPPDCQLTRMVDAASEPVAVADMRNFLRLPPSVVEDDALIADLITAARMECEKINDRSFCTTTWKLTLDSLPFGGGGLGSFALPWAGAGRRGGYGRVDRDDGSVRLPMPPLIALTSIVYLDQGGVSRTLDPASVVVSAGTPGRIAPAYGTFFPFSQPRISAVAITYTAGYGPDASYVPRSIVQAIRLLVSHYYEHRTSNAEVPDAVTNLLDSTRWGSYA